MSTSPSISDSMTDLLVFSPVPGSERKTLMATTLFKKIGNDCSLLHLEP